MKMKRGRGRVLSSSLCWQGGTIGAAIRQKQEIAMGLTGNRFGKKNRGEKRAAFPLPAGRNLEVRIWEFCNPEKNFLDVFGIFWNVLECFGSF